MEFKELGLIEPILRSIQEQGFDEPSEIQEKAIPLVVEGKDVIAASATGSGKTLAFGAGIIKMAERGRGVQALVLTPTRELAEQVMKSLRLFSKHKPLNMIAVYGGVSINPQIMDLRRADVVVGTPGRMIDHIERGTVDLRNTGLLVLDEADRMFEMGFIEQVEQIIRVCPKQRQTLLFSATISDEVALLARRYMINPMRVSAEEYVDPAKLKQVYYNVADGMKFSLLVHLLKNEKSGLVMVFCNTQKATDFVARNLAAAGIKAQPIHGGLSQAKRTYVMSQFNNAQNVFVLVCTDVAARGLDIKGVSHVYNYDIPKDSKQYIHRIGRTARAGKEGIAISILASRDYDNFSRVLNENRIEIPEGQTPYIEKIPMAWRERPRGDFNRGGGFGGQPRRHGSGNFHERPRGHFGGGRFGR